jgi:hypothetical protein
MGGIINRRKLKRLQKEVDALRAARHNITSEKLQSLAKKLGRVRKKGSGGGHLAYESTLILNSRVIIIPANLNRNGYTGCSILDDLESDIQKLFEMLDEGDHRENELHHRELPSKTIR